MKKDFEMGKDYYLEDGKILLSEGYLKNRGFCCGSKCRHCPFHPLYQKGTKILKENCK
jgi:hypothetical protein|tara:strand:+ start:2047 stop:2220 length:174 start_codon:yes stop_codon:yes gene_type:complete